MWTKPIALLENFGFYHDLGEHEEPDMFGIEIEVEGQNILISDTEFNTLWRRTEDGSLRKNKPGDDAWEYRFRGPLNFKNTAKAIELINSRLTKKGVVLYDTGRTSVHVHVNCLSDTLATVYNFITLAVIFDELFVSQNGEHRIGNNFCFRAKDAQGMLVNMSRSINNRGNLAEFERNHRYCSINIASLFKFGTVEFRSMEFTVDKNRLVTWVQVLQELKTAAKRFKNPSEIMSQFSLRGPERFIIDTLGFNLATTYLKVPNHSQMVFDGLRLVQEFANSSTWIPDKVREKPTKSDYKIRLNQILQANAQMPQAVELPQWALGDIGLAPVGGVDVGPIPAPDEEDDDL